MMQVEEVPRVLEQCPVEEDVQYALVSSTLMMHKTMMHYRIA